MNLPYYQGFEYPQNYPLFNPYHQQPIHNQSNTPQANIVCEWVQNKSVAAASPTPPVGVTGVYMDIAQPYVYKKEMGTDGKPLPMETYRLVKEDDSPKEEKVKNYVTTDQIEEIISEKLEDVVKEEVDRRLSEFSFKPTRKPKNSED